MKANEFFNGIVAVNYLFFDSIFMSCNNFNGLFQNEMDEAIGGVGVIEGIYVEMRVLHSENFSIILNGGRS